MPFGFDKTVATASRGKIESLDKAPQGEVLL